VKLSKFLLATAFALSANSAFAAPAYKLVETVPLGAPDRWDYTVFDADTDRVYVAHGDRVTVVDARSAKIVGQVAGIPGGTHGIAISSATGQGFTDDGKNGQAIAFDLKTLTLRHQIATDVDADAVTIDKATGHIFVIEGDPGAITVIDPRTDGVAATIKVGEKLEYGVGDGAGMIYVAGEEKGDIVAIDARTNGVIAHWPVPGCDSPHGLAMDKAGRRLFMGCVNSVMMVVDAKSGHVVATLPIGRGSDAIAFDPKRKRVFSSNGVDGTVTVYQQTSPDTYEARAPITTAVSGRTMTVDPASGRLFVTAADTDPSATPGGRAHPRPGTLKLLVFDPLP
jgi:DNA-binding beta-propeller fold protein YncE